MSLFPEYGSSKLVVLSNDGLNLFFESDQFMQPEMIHFTAEELLLNQPNPMALSGNQQLMLKINEANIGPFSSSVTGGANIDTDLNP
jgi:hypothetical protein